MQEQAQVLRLRGSQCAEPLPAGCNVMAPLATKHCTIIPPPISDETRHPVQSNPATGSEEVLNLGAARYLTVGNFASAGRSLELAENATLQEVQEITPKGGYQ
ncbi:MAG: hypothetical protein JWQ49_2805 [Edaphobacter sp.]|nr:hypothetical protein [Edaphobacter sp.]